MRGRSEARARGARPARTIAGIVRALTRQLSYCSATFTLSNPAVHDTWRRRRAHVSSKTSLWNALPQRRGPPPQVTGC